MLMKVASRVPTKGQSNLVRKREGFQAKGWILSGATLSPGDPGKRSTSKKNRTNEEKKKKKKPKLKVPYAGGGSWGSSSATREESG